MSVSSVFLRQMPFPSDLLLLALSSLSFPPSTLTRSSSPTHFFLFPWVIPPCFCNVWYSGMMSCSILDFVPTLHFLYFCTHCLFILRSVTTWTVHEGRFRNSPVFSCCLSCSVPISWYLRWISEAGTRMCWLLSPQSIIFFHSQSHYGFFL